MLNAPTRRSGFAEASPGSRYYWMDTAKAMAVFLVVVYHVTTGVTVVAAGGAHGGVADWVLFNDAVLPLRMPLFFLVAGLLAATARVRPWRSVVRSRVVALLWPYVLWSIAFALVAGYAYRPDNPVAFAIMRLRGIPVAFSGYWFLLVLPLFFVVAKLFSKWAPLLLLVTLVLAMGAPWLEAHVFAQIDSLAAYGVTRVARYAFWYMFGCYAAVQVRRLTQRNPAHLFFGGGLAYAVLMWSANSAGLHAELSFPMSVAGIVAMLGLARCVSSFRFGRSMWRYLAERTLPIYLLHPMLIVLAIVIARLCWPEIAVSDAAATILVPLLAAAFVAVSVVAYDWIQQRRVPWVFAPPGAVTGSASFRSTRRR